MGREDANPLSHFFISVFSEKDRVGEGKCIKVCTGKVVYLLFNYPACRI
jgi:hypothetical protein